MNWWIQVKCLVNWVENLRNVSKCIFIFCKKYDYYKHGSSRLKTKGKDMFLFGVLLHFTKRENWIKVKEKNLAKVLIYWKASKVFASILINSHNVFLF